MSDLLIRNLDEATRSALKARALQHKRSLSAEARAILEAEVTRRPAVSDRPRDEGLGSYWARRFASIGLTDDELRLFAEGVSEARRSPQPPPINFAE